MTIGIAQMKSTQVIGLSSAADGSAAADTTLVRNAGPGWTANVPITLPASGIILTGTSNKTTFASLATSARTITFPDTTDTVAVLGANTFTGLQTHTISDAATNTVTNALVLGHNTSGTPAANFGTGMKFIGQDSTTTNQDMAAIQAVWTTATHASRTSQLQFQVLSNAGSLNSLLTIAAVGSTTINSGSGFTLGSTGTNSGYLWSNGVIPSTSNYCISATPTFTVVNAPSGATVQIAINNLTNLTIGASTYTYADAVNMAFNATTGTKIGTATTQKIGFWNATPVVQPATTGTTVITSAGAGTALKSDSTTVGNTGATAYSVSDIVSNLKTAGILAA